MESEKGGGEDRREGGGGVKPSVKNLRKYWEILH